MAQPTLASLLNLFLPVWPLPALSPKAPELGPSSWYLLDRPSFRERCRSQGKLHAVNLTEEDPRALSGPLVPMLPKVGLCLPHGPCSPPLADLFLC